MLSVVSPLRIAVSFALALLGSTTSAQSGSTLFSGPTSHVVGWGASAPAVADTNGDGLLDVAVVHAATNTVSVARGKGGFAFEGPVGMSTGVFEPGVSWPFPTDVAFGDFDGDGRQDLAVANAYMGSIAILLQNADAFSLVDNYVVGGSEDSTPFRVASGDLNGDGLSDVVAACYWSEVVSVLISQGGGAFTPAGDVPVGYPGSLQVADVNEDGKLDVIVTSWPPADGVSVLLGNGDGQLSGPVSYDGGPSPSAIEVVDLDDDGHLDIIVANSTEDAISVLPGHGDGTFGVAFSHPAGLEPERIGFGDVDGDGMLDVLVTSGPEQSMSVLLGEGGGALAAPKSISVGPFPWIAATADLNKDGKLDVLIANEGAGTVCGLPGLGTGSFETPHYYSVQELPEQVAVGDTDGDGTPDLIVASYWAQSVSILSGQGDGTFGQETVYGVAGYPGSLALGDLDGDGSLDVAVSKAAAKSVLILHNKGDGVLGGTAEYALPSTPLAIAIDDLDGNGHADMVVAMHNGLLPSRIAVLLGQDGGVFGPVTLYAAGLPAYSAVPEDMDGDGHLDLAVVGTGGASVLLGVGDGTFGAATTVVIDDDLHTTIAVGDLDGDGVSDLTLGSPTTNAVDLLLGTGGGGLTHAATLELGGLLSQVTSVQTGDLNEDEILDIAVAIDDSAQVLVFLGQGGGAFSPAAYYGLLGTSSLVLADVDGNGRLDLIASNDSADTVSVSLNQGEVVTEAWTDLGHGLAGVSGVPSLMGTGRLTPGSSGSLDLSDAAPSSTAALFIALSSTPIPFKCEMLVPVPITWVVLQATEANGTISQAWGAWPFGLTGAEIFLQYAIVDATAPCGISLSNALKATVP